MTVNDLRYWVNTLPKEMDEYMVYHGTISNSVNGRILSVGNPIDILDMNDEFGIVLMIDDTTDEATDEKLLN